MFTSFGKAVRVLRIEYGVTLKKMAEYLGVTSSYVSAVETGKKNPTDELVSKIATFFNLQPHDEKELFIKAAESHRKLTLDLDGASPAGRSTATAFARNFNNLTDEQLEQVTKLVNKLVENE